MWWSLIEGRHDFLHNKTLDQTSYNEANFILCMKKGLHIRFEIKFKVFVVMHLVKKWIRVNI